MRKNIARWAHLVQIVGGALLAVLKVIEVVIDLLNKGANCNVSSPHPQLRV
jgi:hypothetical protein